MCFFPVLVVQFLVTVLPYLADVLLADETLWAAGVMLPPWHWEVEEWWTRLAHAFLIDCTCECFIMVWASYSSL